MSTAAGAIVEVAVMAAAETVAVGVIEVSVADRAAFDPAQRGLLRFVLGLIRDQFGIT
jgi:hypothetical protein